MGELTDKIKAAGNEVAGKVKQAVGQATDQPDVEAEGHLQEAKGNVQHASGTVKGALGDKV